MKLTNKYNLPQPILDFFESKNRRHTDAYASVTGLIHGARETILTDRHFDDIVKDVSDMLPSLMGTAVHDVLEQYSSSEIITEKELLITVLGHNITGTADVIDIGSRTLSDYKNKKVAAMYYDDRIDVTKQLNAYRYMYPGRIDRLEVCYLLKDWSEGMKLKKSDYPEAPMLRFNIPLHDYNDVMLWFTERVQALIDCENLSDDDLPLCSDHERWHRPDKYAVIKRGRKRASAVLNSKAEAEAYIVDRKLDDQYKITHRPGEDVKCKRFCDCRHFCSHYRQLIDNANVEKL